MQARNILYVVPALRRAGAESQLVTLVNGFANYAFSNHIVSYRDGDDLSADIKGSNVKQYRLQRRHRFDFRIGREIAAIIDENDVDLIHCTLMNALVFGLIGRLFAKRKPPVVCVIHTTKNVDLKHEVADILLHRQLLKRCEQIWFVSSRQAQQWIKRMPFIAKSYRVIHNGIDTGRFDPALFVDDGRKFRHDLDIDVNEKVICCIAGLRPEKLHTVLINAFSVIRTRGVRCQLLLAGDGSMRPALQALVKELRLEDCVRFLGGVSDVRPLLAASDCKVLPSVAETFSMAMLESMAMSVPVISTEVGGASEAIDDGVSGVLVAAGDVDGLANSMAALLSDDAMRVNMGVKARETVVAGFKEESMIEKSAAGLQEILAGR